MLGCATMSAQSLSLDSCKALALRNSAAVKNAALDVAAAQEVKKQAFTKYFPNVSVMAGGYYAASPLIEYSIDDIENATARQWLHNLYYEYGGSCGTESATDRRSDSSRSGKILLADCLLA